MEATNFRLTNIKKEKLGHLDLFQVYALYDIGILRDRSARLEVRYAINIKSQEPDLVSTRLEMEPYIPEVPKSTVYFEKGVAVRVNTLNPFPSMDQPAHSTPKVGADYLRTNLEYRAMVELIPNTQPIKQALEKLVRQRE